MGNRGAPVPVTGIWLRRDGSDIVVEAADANDVYWEVIREHFDGPISHEVTEHGIATRFEDARYRSVVLNGRSDA